MNEILTLAEMHDRYQSEWLLIDHPETDENLEIIRGKVVFHSPDRDELYRQAKQLRSSHAAVVYTGELPANAVVVL